MHYYGNAFGKPTKQYPHKMVTITLKGTQTPVPFNEQLSPEDIKKLDFIGGCQSNGGSLSSSNNPGNNNSGNNPSSGRKNPGRSYSEITVPGSSNPGKTAPGRSYPEITVPSSSNSGKRNGRNASSGRKTPRGRRPSSNGRRPQNQRRQGRRHRG
jgi:hypothetical protein